MDGTHIKLTTGGDIITQHTRPRVDNYGWHGLIRNGYEILQYEINYEIHRFVFM